MKTNEHISRICILIRFYGESGIRKNSKNQMFYFVPATERRSGERIITKKQLQAAKKLLESK